MQIIEYQDGHCRCINWELPDTGWENVANFIDLFMDQALCTILAEYREERVEWLEINHWPISGRLMVFPSQDGPGGNREERLYFELYSQHLQHEFNRISDSLPEEERDRALKELCLKVWQRIGDSLRNGQASQQWTEARKVHRLRLAALDHNFGEGPIRLSELDELAAAEPRRKLDRFDQDYEI